MKVFISWSGDRSHKVAQMLHGWLNLVIQSIEPWVSSSDIERGAQWASKINAELEVTAQGIFCLTAENKNAPWILFEAGSLAKGQASSRVYTLLVDIEPQDITGPLVQFNHTQPDKEGMRLLVGSLNERLEDRRLPEAVLQRSFDIAWPEFEQDLAQILSDTQSTTAAKNIRPDKEILYEILELVRGFDARIMKVEGKERDSQSNDGLFGRKIPSLKDLGVIADSRKAELLEYTKKVVSNRQLTDREMFDKISNAYPGVPARYVTEAMDAAEKFS